MVSLWEWTCRSICNFSNIFEIIQSKQIDVYANVWWWISYKIKQELPSSMCCEHYNANTQILFKGALKWLSLKISSEELYLYECLQRKGVRNVCSCFINKPDLSRRKLRSKEFSHIWNEKVKTNNWKDNWITLLFYQ